MTTQIQSAVKLNGEREILAAVVRDLSDDDSKLIYADWLEGHDDVAKAAFLRQYVKAYNSMRERDFPEIGELSPIWYEMIGARHVQAFASQGVDHRPDNWMKLAKPAVVCSSEFDSPGRCRDIRTYTGKDEFSVGATK